VLSRYAADAARGVDGVRGLVERALPYRRGVKLETEERRVKVELRLAVDWGASIPHVGREVQHRVREYLKRMADVDADQVDVVVDEIGPAPVTARPHDAHKPGPQRP
jgi:uncharacterized alkaline shock family protein YloU